jgi:hypothetical protein
MPPYSGSRCLGFMNLYANVSSETTGGRADPAMPSRPIRTVDKEIYESKDTVHPTYFYPENGSCLYLRNVGNTAYIHNV